MGFKKDGEDAGEKKTLGNNASTNPLAAMRQHKEQLNKRREQVTSEPEVAQPVPVAVQEEVRQDKTERARSTQPINKGYTNMSNMNFFDAATPLISHNSSGQELNRLLETGRKYLEEQAQRISGGGLLKWSLIPIPGSAVNYIVDSVALTATLTSNGNTVTAATCLLLMGKNKLPDQVEKENGLQYIYSSVPSDIYTAGYKAAAAKQISSALGSAAGDITLLGSVTVPNTFSYSEVGIHEMLMTFVNDVYFGFIDILYQGENTFDITSVIKDDEEVSGRVVLSPGDDNNVFGAPRRRDISMTVTKQPKRSTNVINAVEGARTGELAKIDAYGDYLWLGRKEQSRRSRRNRDDAEMDIYGLGLNITLLSSGDRQTLEMQLLGLSAVSALVQEDIITQAMQPAGESAYLRSPEALAVEQDKEFGEVPKNPTKEEWAELNEAAVRENSLNVFLHIEENGLLGRVQNIFLDAANGVKSAQRALYDAAFRLTDGKIVDYIDEDTEFGNKEDRVILLGHFTDDKGQIRDLREIDRFFIMTHYGLKGDEKTIELWDNACYNTQLPLGARLAKMEEIIKGCVTNYVVTGHATPIHVNTDWLYGLTDGCAAADLAIPTEGLTVDSSRHQSFTSNYEGRGYEGSAFRNRGRGRSNDYGFSR